LAWSIDALAFEINQVIRAEMERRARIVHIADDDIIPHLGLGQFEDFLQSGRQIGRRGLGIASITDVPAHPADGHPGQGHPQGRFHVLPFYAFHN
jgi:hypothetical protein